MKNRILTAFMLAACTILTGCNDFLTEDPKTNLFKEHIFSNDQMAYVGLVGCHQKFIANNYHSLPFANVVFSNGVFTTTGLDPLANLSATYQPVVELAKFEQNATNTAVGQLFFGIYQAIFTCNDFIANVEVSPLSEESKRRYMGEGRFLRALCYFDAVRLWGRVPLITGPTKSYTEVNRPLSSPDQIFGVIVEDLKYAYANMPTKEGDNGRVKQVKGFPFNMAAYAYLAKVYAHMATSEYMFPENASPYTAGDRADFWEKSYRYADTVYQSKQYRLVADYADLWQCRTNNTEESIHELNYNQASGVYWPTRVIPHNSVYTPCNIYSQSGTNAREFRPSVVSYRWHNAKYGIDADFASNAPNKDRDPRIGETYVVDHYDRNALSVAAGAAPQTLCYPSLKTDNKKGNGGERMPVPIKYCDPLWVTNNTSRMSFPCYRYADLLLVLAEAANETGRPVEEVVGYVNEVLDRARASSVHMPDGEIYRFPDQVQPARWEAGTYADREKLRLEIIKERLFELPLEGHEWFDVRRRGREWFIKITELFNQSVTDYAIPNVDFVNTNPVTFDRRIYVPNGIDATGIDQARKHLFLPIPQDELNNNSALTDKDQNYGY